MAMVRFTTTCDTAVRHVHGDIIVCGKRAGEYTSWPGCRACGGDICPEHMEPDTLQDADLDTPATCLCIDCATLMLDEGGLPDI